MQLRTRSRDIPVYNRREQSTFALMDSIAKSSTSVSSSQLKQAVLEATKTVEQIVDTAERAASEIRAEAEAEAEAYVRQRGAEADRIVEDRLAELADRMQPLSRRIEALRDDSASICNELEGLLHRAKAERPDPPAPTRREFTPPSVGDPEPRPEPDEPEPAPEPPSEPAPAPPSEPGDEPDRGLVARLIDRRSVKPEEVTSEPAVDADTAGGAQEAVTAYPAAATSAASEQQMTAARDAVATPPSPTADAANSDRALLRATQMAVAGSGRADIERALRDELGVGDPGPVIDRVLGSG